MIHFCPVETNKSCDQQRIPDLIDINCYLDWRSIHFHMKRLYTGLTEAGNVTFVWRIQVTKRGIEVPGCGCGRDMKTERTLEVYFYNINECSWQLFGEWNWNKTFLPVSINSSGKRPENTRNNSSLRQKKTTTALEGILSGIDLVKKKRWRNKNDELEAFRLKEHIVASGTITGGLPGQGLVLRSLLRSLGSSHNLLTCPYPLSDKRDCVAIRNWVCEIAQSTRISCFTPCPR